MATTTPHHRLTRKELRQPDEFVSFVDTAGDYLADHLPRVIAGGVALFVLILIGVGLRLYFNHEQRVLAETFYSAGNLYDQKDYKAAETQFAALADQYPDTDLGRLALLYLGDTYLVQQQPAKARDALQKYLKVSDRPAFRQLALLQLGVAFEALGNLADARTAYEQAASIQEGAQDRAELELARLMVAQGDKQGAIAIYERFLREHPFGDQRISVGDALAQLGAVPAATGHSTNTIAIPAR